MLTGDFSAMQKYQQQILFELNRLKGLKTIIEQKLPCERSEEESWFLIHVDETIRQYEKEIT